MNEVIDCFLYFVLLNIRHNHKILFCFQISKVLVGSFSNCRSIVKLYFR